MKFDISNTASDATSALVDIKHPVTGAPIGLQIEVAGPEHPQRKALEFARQRKMRASLAKTGKIEFTDPAEDEQDSIDLLASCTLGWSGVTEQGAAVPFTKDAAVALYSTSGLSWLRAQVMQALGERERFIKTSAIN